MNKKFTLKDYIKQNKLLIVVFVFVLPLFVISVISKVWPVVAIFGATILLAVIGSLVDWKKKQKLER